MPATGQLEIYYYYKQAAFNIDQKGHIFWKKGPKQFITSYSIPFLSVLRQKKSFA